MFVVTTPNLNNNDMFFTGIRDYYLFWSPRLCAARIYDTASDAELDTADNPLGERITIRAMTAIEITTYRMERARGQAVRESLCAFMDAVSGGIPYSRYNCFN